MNLRERAIRGGGFLLLRQATGIIITVTGVLLVTRIIGPRQYGLFAAGAGIVGFLGTFGTWGLDVYLLRKTEEPTEGEFHQAFTVFLLISAALALGVVMLRGVVAGFLKMPEESRLLAVLALAMPLSLLAVPAVVKLDRALNFKQVAINELVSQSAYYFVAVPLAFAGLGAWAPVSGLLTQRFLLLVCSYLTAGYFPRLRWQWGLVKRMLNYGVSYSSSVWVYQLRQLVNPVIVGRLAGAEAVGYVAVSIRIATLISFARTATWRLAMPAFAKLGDDTVRLRKAISEGMRFQAVAVGFPLASFALLAPFLIPVGFGRHWALATTVFPFIALSYLTNAMFNLHASVLYMRGRNWSVTWFHLVHVALFAGGAAWLVPRMGFVGYGWAEVIALPSYAVVHRVLKGTVGTPAYSAAGIWYAAAVATIAFGCLHGPIVYLGFAILLVPLAFRGERSALAGYAQTLWPRVR